MEGTGRFDLAILLIATCGLCAGLALWFFGNDVMAARAWTAGAVPVLLSLVVDILRGLRRGDVGLDIVAALSMSAALAFGETLAAAVVALMYAGGTFLEAFAQGRARREMHGLLSRVPRSAKRLTGQMMEEVPLDAVAAGDRLLIRQGDVVPVDGQVAVAALLDSSAITGESLPVRLSPGAEVSSGVTNVGEPFEMVAARAAADSTYAAIVRLVEQAQASRAPMARLADRWALGFLATTVALAGAAWQLTGDPIRAVAVLVVATPCPLILAVPVALVAGLSRAAQHGVLVKGARALEAMARVRTLVLDKTGTVTDGRPQITRIVASDGWSEAQVLQVAAALDQASKHPVAQALVAAAAARNLPLPVPEDVRETPGEGLTGRIGGRSVAVGSTSFVARSLGLSQLSGIAGAGVQAVALGCDGQLVGHLELADPLREGVGDMLAALRRFGIARIVMATGDRADVAARVTAGLGLDAIIADLTPPGKVALVLAERAGGPVMMVGDGVNDAPALAAADVGVAMGARGSAASAEAADVVLLVDRIDRLAPGLEIARRSRAIALQSVVVGIGLSGLGMVAAALGYLPPVQGALLQEAIDVAVILNALRALQITPR